MGELTDYFKVGFVALIAIELLRGILNSGHRLYLLFLAQVLGEWFGLTCVIGIPAVEIYRRFFSKEKKEESGKVE